MGSSTSHASSSGPVACANPVVPQEIANGITLETVRGPDFPLAPSHDEKGGVAAVVNLKKAGVSTNESHGALLVSGALGMQLLDLSFVDLAFGNLPASLVGASYPLRESTGWSSAAAALVTLSPNVPPLNSPAGPIDAVALVDDGSLSPSRLYAIKLVKDGAQEPAPPMLSHPSITGYPSSNMTLVEFRYLYVRDDGAQKVRVFDLLNLPEGGAYPEVAARSFETTGFSNIYLNAMTSEVNAINGNLAVSYTDSNGTGHGAGVFVFSTTDGTRFRHLRLPEPAEGESLDVPAIRWSAWGNRLLVAWDTYDAGFVKKQSRLLVFKVDPTELATIEDANPETTEVVDPALVMDLPAVHPYQIVLLDHALDWDVVGVITAPYNGTSRLDVYRLNGDCGVEHHAGVELGDFSSTSPGASVISTSTAQYIFVGTARGVQVYRVKQS